VLKEGPPRRRKVTLQNASVPGGRCRRQALGEGRSRRLNGRSFSWGDASSAKP